MNRRQFFTNFVKSAACSVSASLGPDFYTNAVFRTHENKEVFYDDLIKGKHVVINFMYTHRMVTCSMLTPGGSGVGEGLPTNCGWLIPQVVRQLGLHRPLHQSFGQLFQQTLLANQVLRTLVVGQQLVDQLFVDSILLLSLSRKQNPLHKNQNTLDKFPFDTSAALFFRALQVRQTRFPTVSDTASFTVHLTASFADVPHFNFGAELLPGFLRGPVAAAVFRHFIFLAITH